MWLTQICVVASRLSYVPNRVYRHTPTIQSFVLKPEQQTTDAGTVIIHKYTKENKACIHICTPSTPSTFVAPE